MIAALRRAAAYTGRLIEAATNARTLARTVRILARQLDNAHLLAASEEARADRAEADHGAEQMARRRVTVERDAARERIAELEAQTRDWAELSGELVREQPAADALPDLTDASEAPIQIEPPPDAYHERDRADRLQAMLQACEVDLVTARAQLQQTERAAGAHVATIEALREQIAAAHRAAHAIGPDEQIPGVAAATPYAIWSAEYDAAEAARVLAPLAGKLTPDVCDACRRSTFDGQRTGEAEAVLLCGRCRATAEREEAARDAVTEIEPPPPTRPSSATRTT
jgi:hypothetical protein